MHVPSRGSGRHAPGGGDTVTVEIPEHLRASWAVQRIATCGRYNDTLIGIQTTWSLDDLWEAHDVLTLYDELDRKAHREQKGGR